jgi:hypothetical protein
MKKGPTKAVMIFCLSASESLKLAFRPSELGSGMKNLSILGLCNIIIIVTIILVMSYLLF